VTVTADRRRARAPLAARARLRSGLRSVPRAAWLCALVAVVNGVIWSLLVPPLQSFDETVHVYYGQFLAETGQTPRPIDVSYLSEEELEFTFGVKLFDVVGNRDGRPPWTHIEDVRLDARLAADPARVSQGGSGGVGHYPPAYYMLGSAAYLLTPSDSLADRMAAMRLVSSLLAGVAVLFAFLFLRELLPRHPWAWTVGALAVALQPLFGFMSGVFNPDMGMIAASAALFYLLARAFRRGLTVPLAAAIAVAVAVGILSKLAMVGMLPGAALGLLLLALRDGRWRAFGIGAGVFAGIIALYTVVNVAIWNRPALPFGGGGSSAAPATATPRGNWREMLVYIWQDFLPRLPFMEDRFADFPLWERWIVGWTGRFGWGDYEFPRWVAVVMTTCLVLLLAAAISWVLARRRDVLVARWREWTCYLAMTLGLLALLGYTGYTYTRDTGLGFEQGRYLLPLMPLYALLVAAGLRALGRLGPVAGAVLVTACIGWTGWAMAMTVTRFYV
jgi:4-amino-4-deoxy-L-arabinose transferase-like glycosyltransferase